MNRNFIMCYDLETGGKDPEIAQIIQISAKMIDPYTLQVVDEFDSWMLPDFEKEGISEDTVEWHAKQKKITIEEMYAMIKIAPDTKLVWSQFVDWVQKYNKSKSNSAYNAPVPAGFNIINYDNVIMKRYCREFGPWDDKNDDQKLFSQVWKFDMMDHIFFWFESNPDMPRLGQAAVARYMGYPAEKLENVHDANVDTAISTEFLIRFLTLQRYLTKPDKKSGKRRLELKGCLA